MTRGPSTRSRPSAADVLRPALPGLADEIIAAIAARGARVRARDGGHVRPRGAPRRRGRAQPLRRPDRRPGGRRAAAARDTYVNLGRGEFHAGRSARRAARRLPRRRAARLAALRRGGRAGGLRARAPVLARRGDLRLHRRAVGGVRRGLRARSSRRRPASASGAGARLVRLLGRGAAGGRGGVRAAAPAAGWAPPRELAAPRRCARRRRPTRRRRRRGALARRARRGRGRRRAGRRSPCVLVPDPDAPGPPRRLERARSATRRAALGPTVALAARRAERPARAAPRCGSPPPGALPRGAARASPRSTCAALLLAADPALAGRPRRARGSRPLRRAAPPARASGSTETLRAWLDRPGQVQAVAAALDVHPQTVRYRVAPAARAVRRARWRTRRGASSSRSRCARGPDRVIGRSAYPGRDAPPDHRGRGHARPGRARRRAQRRARRRRARPRATSTSPTPAPSARRRRRPPGRGHQLRGLDRRRRRGGARRTPRPRSTARRRAPRAAAAADAGALRRPRLDGLRLRRRRDRAVRRVRADRPARRLRALEARRRGRRRARPRRAHAIVRTAWLFGAARQELRGHHAAPRPASATRSRVVDDQVGCPTYTGHLAPALVEHRRARLTGMMHVAGGGRCSWFDLAARDVRGGGPRGARVHRGSTADLGRPAPRPAYSVLAHRARRRPAPARVARGPGRATSPPAEVPRMKLLVCGGAGFIGSNFVRLRVRDHGDEVVVLDKLTYAGRRENLQGLERRARRRRRSRTRRGGRGDRGRRRGRELRRRDARRPLDRRARRVRHAPTRSAPTCCWRPRASAACATCRSPPTRSTARSSRARSPRRRRCAVLARTRRPRPAPTCSCGATSTRTGWRR